ncbi:hypothetical protein JZ751_011936 [Albula glossodonta]|uniref:Glutaredoxin-like protein n=1 Tax=Albula glossodonta TaxID=121402 RepID=A0A8T2PQZ6_9TELE|nr:hypothetical protein JZ751_011936 [Albula glossodonta]
MKCRWSAARRRVTGLTHDNMQRLKLWHPHLKKLYGPRLLRSTYCSQRQLPILTLFTKEVDITRPENSVWYDRYKYDIPVFHLNGQFLMMHRVNIAVLEKRLSSVEDESI